MEANLKVDLIQFPEDAINVMYSAARTCYSQNTSNEMFLNSKDIEDDKKYKLLDKIVSSGHYSILEMVNLTFAISGVSRVLLAQDTRHRHKSFAVKSQRYVTYHEPFKYIIPKSIKNCKNIINTVTEYKKTAEQIFEEHMDNCQKIYSKLLEMNIPADDARFVFPNACETSFVFNCNLRELMHICSLRLCGNAQVEIQDMYKEVKRVVMDKNEWMGKLLNPKCVTTGKCNEFKSCKL